MADLKLEAGATVSHFRLEKKLGEGGMGAVYLAEDLTLSRRVAIKFMSRALLAQVSNPTVRESIEKRFIREARSAAAINHPNLAQIYEANFESNNWYIAMEFIDGQAIDEVIASGRVLSVQEIIGYTRQIIAGLSHAWEFYKIVHRDIKPANIMITRQDMVKIVDMGLAKPMTSAKDGDDGIPDITCAGQPIGTPQYMAPEQATGESDINNRVDIFALGATLYELIASKKCFNERTAPLIYMAQMQRKYTRLIDLRPDIPEGLSELIDDMLQPSAMERIGDYKEIQERLDTLGTMAIDMDATMVVPSGRTPAKPAMGTATLNLTGAAETPTAFYPSDFLVQDRFRVIRPIGKSRAGHVYLCMDTQLGVECALKTLYPGREFEGDAMALVRENFQRLLGMSHADLVQIRDLRQSDKTGELYVVMELLSGRNLREYTHKKMTELGALGLDTVLPVAHRIAKSLDSINKTFGMVHYDLKPESIYLCQNDAKVKLLDYGITTRPIPETTRVEPGSIPLNHLPMNNPDYMSPELWQDLPPTLQSDQYSLAVVLYEMLSRKLPFWLRDPSVEDQAKLAKDKRPLLELQLTAMREKVLTQPPAPIATLSKGQNAVLLRAMSKQPQERFATCEEFVTALERAGSGGGLAKPLMAAAAAVVLLGVAGGGWLVLRPKPPVTPEIVPTPTLVTLPPVSVTPTSTGTDSGTGGNPDLTSVTVKQPVSGTTPVVTTPVVIPTIDTTGTRITGGGGATATADQKAMLEERLRKQIEIDRTAGAELRQQLVDKDATPAMLQAVDDLTDEGAKALAAGDLKTAGLAYGRAVKEAVDQEAAANLRLKGIAEPLAVKVAKEREQTIEFDEIDPRIAEAAADYKLTVSLADKDLQMKEYKSAIARYTRASEINTAILKVISDTFRPTEGKDFVVPKVGMEFVWIPAMKCWVGKYEVTNADYRKLKPTHNSKKTEEGFDLNGERQPAIRVSYYDSVAYCSWMTDLMRKVNLLPDSYSFRLPTTPEWKTFATTGEERVYPWGNDWPPPNGNFGNQEVFPQGWDLDPYTDEFPATCPVEKSGENPWHLFGTAGNVWEWTSEEKAGQKRVIGASWAEFQKDQLKVVLRGDFNYGDPSIKDYDNIGFRIILAPKIDETK